ncbi:MAG TPA: metalloregulator ArsR/SmtB family transcription factor [Bacillota bacterium]
MTYPDLQTEPTGAAAVAEELARAGRALGDPIRVRILMLLAQGRACCAGLDLQVPAEDGDVSVCVCELQAALGLQQSRVSYHLGLLREAGLVEEERRGRWSFYRLNRSVLNHLAASLARLTRSLPAQPGAPRSAPAPVPGQAPGRPLGGGEIMGCCGACCGGGCCGGCCGGGGGR